ncbi:bifunctional hydroxymethylpyrimidine kinase/phosphomethylpyrimidine kinase [Pseudoduganella rivuli]|uniref:bifunctional hydroxymethylpyrimidine kinase/phosphomethylpyrimidine kinase n=1 Tax=Pseudoduganella rivuli TaxID=2666085 RepID=UPI0035309D63
MQNQTSPLILTFGASDPVGATGVTADLAVFSALGCNGLAVTTALLIGDSASVEDMQEVDPDWVADQARVLLEDAAVAAFKIGALHDLEHASAIAEIVSDYPDAALVLDPFGSRLPDIGDDADEMLTIVRQLLVPQASVLVLSRDELARLAETWSEGDDNAESDEDGEDAGDADDEADDEVADEVEDKRRPAAPPRPVARIPVPPGCELPDEAEEADPVAAGARHLIRLGCEFVLVTGTIGEGDGGRANTLYSAEGLVRHDGWRHLPGPFIGAGGTLSAAIAAFLAQGADTPQAVGLAQEYTHGALAHAQRYGMGKLVPNRTYRMQAI